MRLHSFVLSIQSIASHPMKNVAISKNPTKQKCMKFVFITISFLGQQAIDMSCLQSESLSFTKSHAWQES